MSDMNLPTLRITVQGNYADLQLHSDILMPRAGTYALVPVDAMEKVWWCAEWGLLDAGRVDVCHRVHGDVSSCGERYLVSAKEEE